MKLSYNWLKQYVDFDLEPEKLSLVLTDIGLEVEGLEKFQSVKGGLEGVVIGEVKTCERHPNADRLSVTTVDVGTGKVLPIVCGAPNVAAGQKVLVATVGTKLYSGDDSFEIKKAKIRGEVSEGMICAEDELGLGESHEGIMVLPAETEVGIPAKEYFNIEEDYIYEIGLTPNRADAASHLGAACDLVAGLNRLENTRRYQLKVPSVVSFRVDTNDLDIDVIVEDTVACPRYTGVTLSDIKVGESPGWLKNRLNGIGLRPINNIVDITNYVLHETGQPLHAFDASEIKGNQVIVRKTPQNTPFVTLDEIERKLDKDDLMICDSTDGMCIAGVFGGVHSGVTEKTTSIFLESAYFDPSHIRKTSKRHALQTDASFRFERGADPNITEYALKRAIMLIQEVAGGIVSSEIKDVYPKPIEKWSVEISYDHVDRLIGNKIDREIIKTILQDLNIGIKKETAEGLSLLIPTNKVDVKREADVIEEILRIYGFNNITFVDKIAASVSVRPKPDTEKIQNLVADQLSSKGFSEIMNNSITNSDYYSGNKAFDENKNVKLLNALSQDLDILRQSLLFGGLEVISYNINRKTADLKLYEFGNVYIKKDNSPGLKKYNEQKYLSVFVCGLAEAENWNSSDTKVDFYYLKGILESVLLRLGLSRHEIEINEISDPNFSYGLNYSIKGKQIAVAGELSKKLLSGFEIKEKVFMAEVNWDLAVKNLSRKEIKYKAVSRFPAVRRDLALLVDTKVKFADLKAAAFNTERKLLQSVSIFDIYEGDKIPQGKKSYALSFLLQDEEKTLTDKIIDKTMRRIQQTFEQQFKAELR